MKTIELYEEFLVLYLDRKNSVLGYRRISRGGVTGTIVDPKIILSIALKVCCTSIILAHNHPSGNLKPSESDIKITKKLKDASEFLDIELLDHLILTQEGCYSFADEGVL